jgi:hypothetical protein
VHLLPTTKKETTSVVNPHNRPITQLRQHSTALLCKPKQANRIWPAGTGQTWK